MSQRGTHSLLEQINHGYGHLEPLLLGLGALRRSFLLLGRHGTGKTRLAKHLSLAWDRDAFGFYDATKDDLISIAGLPDPEGMKEGTLRFVPHQRTIWDKKTIVVDEITRAAKENQNLWLEIIEERKCFGLPLPYDLLIATANPESYAAAFQLDEALLDRFYAVVPVPEMQERIQSEDVRSIVRISMGDKAASVDEDELKRAFLEIRRIESELRTPETLRSVENYVGAFVPVLMRMIREQNACYLSPRSYARNFPETILSTAAALTYLGHSTPLVEGAAMAGIYTIATRLQISPATIEQIHGECLGLLGQGKLNEEQQIRTRLASMTRFNEKLTYLQENWTTIIKHLTLDEREKEIGDLLRICLKKGERDKLVALHQLLDGVDYQGDARRQVEGKLIITLNKALDSIRPEVARLRQQDESLSEEVRHDLDRFSEILSDRSFSSSTDPGMVHIKRFLIDVWEGDRTTNPESLRQLIAGLEQVAPAAGTATS